MKGTCIVSRNVGVVVVVVVLGGGGGVGWWWWCWVVVVVGVPRARCEKTEDGTQQAQSSLEPERCIWNRKGAFGTGKRPKHTTKNKRAFCIVLNTFEGLNAHAVVGRAVA